MVNSWRGAPEKETEPLFMVESRVTIRDPRFIG
jgi:hypothetical protein